MSRARRRLGLIALAGAGLVVARGVIAGAPSQRSASANDIARLRQNVAHDERSLTERFRDLETEAKLTESRMLWRGRLYVRLSRAGLLPMGDGFEAFVDHAARLERLHHGLELDLARSKELAAERVAVGKKLDELRARSATLDDEQRALARAEDALRSAEERERAFSQAFETGAHTAVYGAVGPEEPGLPASGFAALKGRLPFPIAGRSEIRAAHRANSDGPGLEMRAAAGSVVRTVAAGRVAFADTYADYGKTVIIEHGRRYYSVSANLGTIDVSVGQEISAGERVGTVGESEGGARLYFELRVGKETVDPAPWFGI